MLEFLDHQLIQGNADHQSGNTDGKQQKEDVFFQFRPELFLDIAQGEIGDKDSGDLLFRFMARKTFLPNINGIHVPKDLFSPRRRVNDRLIQGLRRSTVANLTCRIMDIDNSSRVLIVDGDNNSANPIEDENVLDIRILLHRFKDIFHLILVFGQHGALQDIIDHLSQMRADVLLKVVDHLFSVVIVLDGKKDGHGEGEKTDQPKDDLKAKAFIKFDLSHRIPSLSAGEKKS